MKNTYYVDYMSKWNRRWGILDAFTDMYEAIDYAVKVSKETEEPHKIRVYDSGNEKVILLINTFLV